jgi:hypothetical protein
MLSRSRSGQLVQLRGGRGDLRQGTPPARVARTATLRRLTVRCRAQDTKLIYRHFATLYFIVLCDKSESELGILDLIQGAHGAALRRVARLRG